MFALEISFSDGVSQPEMVFIRRPQALIGASDYAHVVVEDMKSLDVQLRLVREVGRRFRCKPVGTQAGSLEMSSLLEGVYEGDAEIDLGSVKFHITALDSDLLLRDAEPPDKAGVRILRQSCSAPSPKFPALVIGGNNGTVISFVPGVPIYVGRGKQCNVRLENSEVSAKHARFGYEGGEFWVEDLGSTNGTFLNEQQISGRASFEPLSTIMLGKEVTIQGIGSQAHLDQIGAKQNLQKNIEVRAERKYPILFSLSEIARPARIVLTPGNVVHIGRDPISEFWLGAPHVSRRHCSVYMTPIGSIVITDSSSNGTSYDRGLLQKGDEIELNDQPTVLDFGGGITVAICFNQEQEKSFVSASGSASVFTEKRDLSDLHESQIAAPRANRNLKPSRSTLRASNVEKILQFYRELSLAAKFSIIAAVILMMMILGIVLTVLSGLW
jgi:pSer/pThr/pTyr-binding forkhead associated (FHA) protein